MAESEPHRPDRGRRWVAAEVVLEVDEIGHCVDEPPLRRRAVAVVTWGRRRRRGWLRGVTAGDRNGVEDDRWGELASGWRFAVCDLHPSFPLGLHREAPIGALAPQPLGTSGVLGWSPRGPPLRGRVPMGVGRAVSPYCRLATGPRGEALWSTPVCTGTAGSELGWPGVAEGEAGGVDVRQRGWRRRAALSLRRAHGVRRGSAEGAGGVALAALLREFCAEIGSVVRLSRAKTQRIPLSFPASAAAVLRAPAGDFGEGRVKLGAPRAHAGSGASQVRWQVGHSQLLV